MNSDWKNLVGRRSARDFDVRLTAYLAAAGTAGLASTSDAAIVAHTSPQSFGINQEVNIDFNSDGQIDFQIDHDRVNLGGTDIDYLQIDKNDVSSAANPLPIGNFETFPVNGTHANSDSEYLSFKNSFGDLGGYAVALKAGDLVGASGSRDGLVEGTQWDFQEGDNFVETGTTIRANRLIDEDHGQIDTALNPGEGVTIPYGKQLDFPLLDDFTGLGGAVRYLGVRVDLNDAIHSGFNDNSMSNQWVYGWIGVRIDNEADATGTITGWAYQSTPGMAIAAGDAGPIVQSPDFNDDGTVDGADLLMWQQQMGSTVPAFTGADGTGDGLVNSADLTLWRTGFGSSTVTALPVSVGIPEPGSVSLAIVGAVFLFGTLIMNRWRSRHAKVAC
jgi:hypothetical protein